LAARKSGSECAFQFVGCDTPTLDANNAFLRAAPKSEAAVSRGKTSIGSLAMRSPEVVKEEGTTMKSRSRAKTDAERDVVIVILQSG
jgi:hypothetical protein